MLKIVDPIQPIPKNSRADPQRELFRPFGSSRFLTNVGRGNLQLLEYIEEHPEKYIIAKTALNSRGDQTCSSVAVYQRAEQVQTSQA
ncbi:hypothetical protein KKC08_03240 [Patescibacteria group bacterium]|nr:hypothetical protein [Patescibacteria group bacterium]MBU4431263.1 hypothetical protein [Patescibacteria group bacterium]MBU4578635.1 hypothetical protein [Patescibacteria group bacterium]MCG2702516.1 hypothetical protein [Candidatus Parcubacteria bacterium]